MLKVAFIDDGINTSLFNIKNLSESLCVKENRICKCDEQTVSAHSHGTVCAAIYSKYVTAYAVELISVKVINENSLKGRVADLAIGLNWCIENDVDIVNCSAGTTNFLDFACLNKVIYDAKCKNVIIIGALSNSGIYTMPACAENVIGVKSGILYNNGTYKLRWHSFDDIEIVTNGKNELKLKNNDIYNSPSSNSFAAPIVTALVANIINKTGCHTYTDIMHELQRDAVTVIGEQLFDGSAYIWNSSKITAENFDSKKYSRVTSMYIDNNTEINIPVISVYGSNVGRLTEFVDDLIKMMYNTNIYCRVVTACANQIKFGYIPCPDNVELGRFISNIIRKFENDVIVLLGNKPYKYADITVNISGNSIIVDADDEEFGLHTEYVDAVYAAIKIIDYLTD